MGSFHASRREFLQALVLAPAVVRAVLRGDTDLALALISEPFASDAARGAELSANEAARTAQLLGGTLELHKTEHYGGSESVLILACAPERVRAIAGETTTNDVVIINTAAAADRVAMPAARNLFHIAATDAQLAQLWSADLDRFGAAQLNARYQHAYGSGMSSLAWAGWFAVKACAEAALRTRTVAAPKIAEYLITSEFDGHKGKPMHFDSSTHVLTS